MSKNKIGIASRYKPPLTLHSWANQWRPNKLCYLCQQPSEDLICTVCIQDCLFFNSKKAGANLLHWPRIRADLLKAPYSQLQALSYYQWPLDYLIQQFKYGHPQLAKPLAALMLKYIPFRENELPDCLLPVPISLWRYSTRRYHQTLLLAKSLGEELRIPVLNRWASRNFWQGTQQSLGRKERLANLKSAWCIEAKTLPKKVAIVDDVVTTGATAATLSRLLQLHFPQTDIALWCLAITPKKVDPQLLSSGGDLDQQSLIPLGSNT